MQHPKISQFTKQQDKKDGITRGFIATKDNQTYMIKSFKNGNLTKREKEERLKEFKKSLRESSKKNGVDDTNIENSINAAVEQICYDDLNLGDCIREYITAPIYQILLGDMAPDVQLVEDDKNEGRVYLSSEFITDFITASDNKQDFKKAKGFEKIIAAQLLLGEADIIQPGNFGAANGKCGKIDHGRSAYISSYSTLTLSQYFLSLNFSLQTKALSTQLTPKDLSEMKKYINANELKTQL